MKEKKRLIPKYSIIPLGMVVIWNQLVYGGAMLLTKNWKHYNFETILDKKIPFLPWTVSIYLACYLFWTVNYILCARMEKKDAYRFFRAEISAKLICLFFFLLLPTTNIRPEITGNSVWDMLMQFVYNVDEASNLFPSIHCLVSWFCYIGIRGRKEIPIWYRAFSCLMAIAVFISTLTTKQHVLMDVVGGVLLAEVSFGISGAISGARIDSH